MSQWTHVNGNVRFDYLPIKEDNSFEKELKEVLGPMIGYDHIGLLGEDHQNCPTSNIPCGSEGSIQYEIYKVDRGYNLGVYGDLRNFGSEEVESILTWIGKIMTHKFSSPHFVRCAMFHIDIEYGDDVIILDDMEAPEKFKKYILPKENQKTRHTER